MAFGNIISSPRGSLSLQQVLDLANIYLENARKTTDPSVALVLCHDTETSLSHVKRAAKNTDDKAIREGIATIYNGLGELLNTQGHRDEAQAFYKKSEKWGGRANESGRHLRPTGLVYSIKSALHSTSDTTTDKSSQNPSTLTRRKQEINTAIIPKNIFPTNVHPPTIVFSPPEPDSRLNDTPQLACCLGLLRSTYELDDILDPAARNWLMFTKNEQDERDRLESLATDVIRAFKRDEFKDSKAVTEVMYLAPILEKDDFEYLLKEFYSGIDQSGLLDVHQLEGIAQLIQGADPGYLDSDDLVKVLSLLSTRLRDTHQQSTKHLYQLTVAVSHVLDAMADANVSGLDREEIHEPLSSYLDGLKSSSDPYLVYQAAYAYQALLCVPDDESLWQASFRRAGKVIQGVSVLVSAVKGLDLNGFVDGLKDIQQGLAGASEIAQIVKDAYDGAVSLAESGQGFFACLQEGFSFKRKCAWYSALRGADTLIRDGQLAEFRRLVCEAPCRRDAAFQWGLCQRLGEVAINSLWTAETRQSAIAFLGEIYQNDPVWGYQANVKQWILNILMQMSSGSGSVAQFVEALLQDLRKDEDTKKQVMCITYLEKGPGAYPLKVSSPIMGSPSLLDRVQERPDVEGALRQLRRHRLKERGNAVYIPPQAKASLQARDEACFPLMERVDDFMASDHEVLLLLGVSGAGKSTFNRELECRLWQSYKKNAPIPLHINLPAIDKPEHDMIVKQLRRAEFTEPQIRELKLYRTFTLICDGYDESQLTHNLYTSNRLNEPGEWNAKMVVTCRSEYVGVDYRDRFQPGGRNQRSGSALFQEVVMTPFSLDQVQDYISQYVSVYRPLWEADEYKRALELIPSLKELVKNPFLMSLSLEVLPRIVDPGQGISATHVTRMALYDQFIENWLERGKKRLGEKNLSPQAKAAFESLTDEGFTRNGVDYLKKLSVAIYKEQGGQPIVSYSRYKDEDTWKANFFNRDDEKQLLREACPLTRSGNQHRFIHRSLLEYGVALAVFDPQEVKEKTVPESSLARRGSAISALSSDGLDPVKEISVVSDQRADLNSPLVWRSFVNEPSVSQFLEERVQQEPLFKQQLHDYIEQSKNDKKWRMAASNAITILVRAGVQFIKADLRGIRIPNADLSYGVFDSAQFQGADLRHVDFRCAWLRRTNFSQAQMLGVQFGELPFLKHDSEAKICVYSPDGKTVAAGLFNCKIAVYSTSSWECLWTLDGHSDTVKSIAYSPNGNQIASGGDDGTVRLWDVFTGGCTRTLNGHSSWIGGVAYSPQGDQVVSASYDMTVKVWDVDTGDCRHILIGHSDCVRGVVYSPKGEGIASNSQDRTVRLWDIEAQKCLHVLRGHRDNVRSIAYSPQGDQLASASNDKTVRLWNVATGDCHHVLSGHSRFVYSVIYSPNGDRVASASTDMSIRLWDVDTGTCLHTLLGHNGNAKVVYSPQGDLVASASNDKTVRVWDTETGICRQTLAGHSKAILCIVFSPEGDQIVSTSYDNTIRLWVVGTRTSRHISNSHVDSVRKVLFSPGGDQVATCSEDKTARLWDVKTGTCRQILRGHSQTVLGIAYSPQGDKIATCSSDNNVKIWGTETGECISTLSGHTSEVNYITYSPHGDQLASASDDRTVRLWDAKAGECRHTLTGHTNLVMGAVYSPTGNQIASFSWDSTVRIWDAETGVCTHTLTGHSSDVKNIAYSPQGDQVVSVSEDTTVQVWDVLTGERRHNLIGHDVEVCSVTYSPRGDQIASGGTDGSLRLWNQEAATCLWTLDGHGDEINRILYSSRGDLVISAGSDQSVRLWDITSGQCRAVIRDFQDDAKDIAWIEVSDVNYLATACSDGSVGMWQVRVDGDQCHVSMSWMTTKGELNVQDASIQEVQGLSQPNRELLKQRGAIGEPANRLREASKKVTTMASVVSKLKTSSDITKEDPVLTSIVSAQQLEQLVNRVKDPKLRDMLAVCFKDIHEYM